MLGRGGFGGVSEAFVEVNDDNVGFAIKQYDSKDEAERAMKNYLEAKKAGLRVFPTCRISEDGLSLIMTTGHKPDWTCVGSNNSNAGGSLESLGLSKMESIKNLDDFLEAYFGQAEIADRAGVVIFIDVPFFFVGRGGVDSRLDFVLGDCDNLLKVTNTQFFNLYTTNVNSLSVALEEFLNRNVNNPQNYLNRMKQFVLLLISEGEDNAFDLLKNNLK